MSRGKNGQPSRWLAGAALTLVAAGTIWARRYRRFEVRGASMLPTARPGDRFLVRRTSRRTPPSVGDLVIVTDPTEPGRQVLKRLAAADARGATVLGDNPQASTDSRTWGPVPAALVTGVVVRRYHRR